MNNGDIILKAFLIYHDGLLHGDYEHDRYIIENSDVEMGKTPGEARYKGMYLGNGSLGRDLLYTDIKSKRKKSEDLVYFNGEKIKRWKMDMEIDKLSRIDKFKNSSDEFYYLQDSRSYVGNAVLWWGINGNGYTTDPGKANKYTREEVLERLKTSRETDIYWPASKVEAAIKNFVDIQGLNREDKI